MLFYVMTSWHKTSLTLIFNKSIAAPLAIYFASAHHKCTFRPAYILLRGINWEFKYLYHKIPSFLYIYRDKDWCHRIVCQFLPIHSLYICLNVLQSSQIAMKAHCMYKQYHIYIYWTLTMRIVFDETEMEQ